MLIHAGRWMWRVDVGSQTTLQPVHPLRMAEQVGPWANLPGREKQAQRQRKQQALAGDEAKRTMTDQEKQRWP